MIGRIARFWLIFVAGSLAVIYGLVSAEDSVHQWTSSPLRCPPPGRNQACAVETINGGWASSPWASLGIGLGSLAVGVCLLLLARRVKRRRAARPALG